MINYVEVPRKMKYDEFKTWMIAYFGLHHHPQADLWFRMAYERGHACGMQDVFIEGMELYQLLNFDDGEVRADEREKVACFVEKLPPVASYRIHGSPVYHSMTPKQVADKIRNSM